MEEATDSFERLHRNFAKCNCQVKEFKMRFEGGEGNYCLLTVLVLSTR